MLRRLIRQLREQRRQETKPLHHYAPRPEKKLSDWEPKYPHLQLQLAEKIHPALRHAFANNTLPEVIETIAPSIYRFPLLAQETVQQFDHELKELLYWIETHNVRVQTPNSMNQYGLILSHIGFQHQLNQLMKDTIRPLATMLFPEVGGESIDEQHSFIVDYGMSRDTDLGFHVDNSEVTLNFCIGGNFTGSNLYFQGRRCAEHRQTHHKPQEHLEIEHQPGMAILHAGAHRHGVYPLSKGDRRSLIMWCTSSTYRANVSTECPDWCGEHTDSM